MGASVPEGPPASPFRHAGVWPANSPAPPFVQIDHVLVSPDFEVASFQTLTLPGSDHLAVVSALSYRG